MMKTQKIFLLSALLLFPFSHALAIPDGEVDEQRRFSFVVRLLTDGPGGSTWCSGVLIAPRFVLTAGHCVADAKQRSGSIQVFFDERQVGVADYAFSENLSWSINGMNLTMADTQRVASFDECYCAVIKVARNDLAILYLDAPVSVKSFFKPLKLSYSLVGFEDERYLQLAIPDDYYRFEKAFLNQFELDNFGRLRVVAVGFGSSVQCGAISDCQIDRTRRTRQTVVMTDISCGKWHGKTGPNGRGYSTFDVMCVGGQQNGDSPMAIGDSGGPIFAISKDKFLVLISIMAVGDSTRVFGPSILNKKNFIESFIKAHTSP